MSDSGITPRLGRAIKQARLDAGKSQTWLARRAALGRQQTVLKLESGTRGLSFAEAVRVCRVLGFPLEELATLVPDAEACQQCGGTPPEGFICSECGEAS